MLSIRKAFNLLGDDTKELFPKNESFKNKKGSYDGKWLLESSAKLLKQINDEKKAILFMSRMQKQMEKQKKA